jgi:serine/threonine protein kinase
MSTPELVSGMRLRSRYIIERTIGRGGFGRTYLARDIGRFDEPVAIKELLPLPTTNFSWEKAEELFQREAKVLYKLNHPQIPRFWEFFREGTQLYLAQDYIAGETYQVLLKQRLEQGRCFSEAEIIQLFLDLLPVLSYLHRKGVIHRDVSPDNIIHRTGDNLPVLIDLGGVKQVALNVANLTKGIDNESNITNTRLGKLGFAPDEQMRLGVVSPASDLYALGVTAIVLMTGKMPQELIDPHSMNWLWDKQLTCLSSQTRRILHRMLEAKPAKRFQSADEILQLIEPGAAVAGLKYPLVAYSGKKPTTSPAQPKLEVEPDQQPRSLPILSSMKTEFTNTSGRGSMLDNSIQVPDEIQGWNWGAFLLPGIWCIPNKVWIGLLAWADPTLVITLGLPWFGMGVILGVKGNEWAWKSRRWRSVEAFKAHQRGWAIISLVIVGFFVLALLSIGLIVFVWVGSLGR